MVQTFHTADLGGSWFLVDPSLHSGLPSSFQEWSHCLLHSLDCLGSATDLISLVLLILVFATICFLKR